MNIGVYQPRNLVGKQRYPVIILEFHRSNLAFRIQIAGTWIAETLSTPAFPGISCPDYV